MWPRVLIHGVTSLTLLRSSADAKCLSKNMHCALSVVGVVCANLRYTFVRFDKFQESLQFAYADVQIDYSSVFCGGLWTHLSRVWVF